MNTIERLLQRFVLIRERAGISAKELSLKLDRNEQYITKIESGKFFPRVDTLEKILHNINSSLGELFYEGELEDYKEDKETMKKLKEVDTENTEGFLTFLTLLFHKKKAKQKKISGKA